MLILDDDAAVAQTIQWIAESIGFDAEYVTRPDEFFQRLDPLCAHKKCPSVITIDLVMPELDGVEIMRLLAERKCAAKIVISSGMGSRVLEAAERSAAEHGLCIAGAVSKPLTREALRAVVGDGNEEDAAAEEGSAQAGRTVPQVTEEELRDAIRMGQIDMVYQPKIECRSGSPAGLEALARWQSPKHGLVMPDIFIPLAESTGMIDVLTGAIFRKSIEWFARAFPNSPITLSLNLSAKSLVDLYLADNLSELCGRYAIAPERIVLELTETSAMVDPVLSVDLMTRLRMKGFHLSIDDFGTGYSSMVQLARLPFSELKVDKSFVMQAKEKQESRTIIKSMIDLGHNLGLRVTAEGVEDQEVLDYLNSVDCDLAQGYFIARPMPGQQAREWVEQRCA
jgi:EAL domain-containing protein (putative c-di-GMP-specific phosphodiesterase class I)/FixJ family two-component response regulator